MTDEPINFNDRKLQRMFRQLDDEYARLRPQFDALRASTSEPHCVMIECFRQIAIIAPTLDCSLGRCIDILISEYDSDGKISTADKLKALDEVREIVLQDAREVAEFLKSNEPNGGRA